VCAVTSLHEEPLPVDTYLVVDASAAMEEAASLRTTSSWWTELGAAVEAYVGMKEAADFITGLQLFPSSLTGRTCSGYEKPSVVLGALSETGADIIAALEERSPPSGPSAAGPALAAAHSALMSRDSGADRMVVLVTRGEASACEPTDLAQIARQALHSPVPVLTQVVALGVNDPAVKARLDRIAKAGGTENALSIDGADVKAGFANAMFVAQNGLGDCDIEFYDPPTELQRVSVYLRASTGPEQMRLPRLQSSSDCELNGGVGWYIDETTSRPAIVFCIESCVQKRFGSVEFRFGCDFPAESM
jgi:hypothetical protein